MAKITDAAVDRVRSLRPGLVGRLADKPNVVGSMIGAKLRDDRLLDRLVLTLLVTEKVPELDLSPIDRIPKRLKTGFGYIETDVLTFDGLVLQADPFPALPPLTTSDGTEDGTLTAFARSRDGLFGLTCAHAIEGADNDPYTQSPVFLWSPALRRRLPVGRSALALAGGGAGVPGAFGFSDAALFTLEQPDLARRAQIGAPIKTAIARPLERLQGFATSGPKLGEVAGIELSVGDHLIDLFVRVAAPGTFVGDSGFLWRRQDGAAVAIHAKGTRAAPGSGSIFSACMHIHRATQGLGVELVEI